MKRTYTGLVALLMAVALLGLAPGSNAAVNTDSVVLVPLAFNTDQGWTLGLKGVSILPCAGPTKVIRGREGDPFFRVLDAQEEQLLRRSMRNPRLVLVEDPETETPLLRQVDFVLRFALRQGMARFEFWDPARNAKEPSVTADLREAIKRYMDNGGPNQKAPCQQPEYDFSKPPVPRAR